MELWQTDVVGGVLLADGREAKILTGIDDHSRFVVCAGLMLRATSRAVCSHFAEAMRRHGVPQEILADRGKVFTGRFGAKDTERSCSTGSAMSRGSDIDHLLTAPRRPSARRPQDPAVQRTLRTEFLTGRVLTDLATAQAEIDLWVVSFNTERQHVALHMTTPPAGSRPPSPDDRPDAARRPVMQTTWRRRTASPFTLPASPRCAGMPAAGRTIPVSSRQMT